MIKIIVKNVDLSIPYTTNNKIADFVFKDNKTLFVDDNGETIIEFYDINKKNSRIVEVSEIPKDFVFEKYCFKDEEIILNENYIEPEIDVEE